MNIDLLLNKIDNRSMMEAIVYNNKVFLFNDLLNLTNQWAKTLKKNKIISGNVVALIGDYSPESIALVIALIRNKNIIVPLAPSASPLFSDFFKISHTEFIINLSNNNHQILSNDTPSPKDNDILRKLINIRNPGLILFTSGSTGKPKAVVHDFDKLLQKFVEVNKSFKTLCFLMFDHIAGIDTYFYSLFSGGTAIFPDSRNPANICKLIEKYKIEVLPTSPTFLNLLLLSNEYQKYDLSSLKIITFGSESMPEFLLNRLKVIFKDVQLIQKYGMTEFGSPPSKTKRGDSSWLKINSDQFKTKIIDNILYVKADTTMMGYLNAPTPFQEDGWFKTGDSVEVDGEYIKILGRKSEIINVGGEKVYPQEVENVILKMDNIAEVTVYSEKNPIMGNIVCAKVRLIKDKNKKAFINQIKKHCKERLQSYKVPVKVNIDDQEQYSDRYKKIRQFQ